MAIDDCVSIAVSGNMFYHTSITSSSLTLSEVYNYIKYAQAPFVPPKPKVLRRRHRSHNHNRRCSCGKRMANGHLGVEMELGFYSPTTWVRKKRKVMTCSDECAHYHVVKWELEHGKGKGI